MQALIDNYTAFAANISGSSNATVDEAFKTYTPVSSIIFHFDVPDMPYLNEREIRLLREYKRLEDNWDGEGAKAPGKRAVTVALYLVKALQAFGQKVFHVAPGPRGEILVDLRNKNKSIELLFYEDRSKFVRFPETERPDQGSFELNLLPGLLKWLNG
jgi:hypothetical protein